MKDTIYSQVKSTCVVLTGYWMQISPFYLGSSFILCFHKPFILHAIELMYKHFTHYKELHFLSEMAQIG